MKEEFWNQAIDEVEDKYVAEAVSFAAAKRKKRRRALTLAAACLAFALTAAPLALRLVRIPASQESGRDPAPGGVTLPAQTEAPDNGTPKQEPPKTPAGDGNNKIPAESGNAGTSADDSGAGTSLPPEQKQPYPTGDLPAGPNSVFSNKNDVREGTFLMEDLTYDEARTDKDFGVYMLPTVPEGFRAEQITKSGEPDNPGLSGLFTKGYDELRWQVSLLDSGDIPRITSVGETANYDLSLYPVPRADSVPQELREIVADPIFNSRELTPEALWARAETLSESGDSDGYRMRFSVLYEPNILVEISSKGVSPDWIYGQLSALTAD